MVICPRVSHCLNFATCFPVVLFNIMFCLISYTLVDRKAWSGSDCFFLSFFFFSKPLHKWYFVPLPGGIYCLIFGLWGPLQVVSWVFLIWASESLIAILISHMTKHSGLTLHIYPRSAGSFYCGKNYLGKRLWVIGMLVATGVLIVSRPFQ